MEKSHEEEQQINDNELTTDIAMSPVSSDSKLVLSEEELDNWNNIVNAIVSQIADTDLPDDVIQATELLIAGYPTYKAAKKLRVTPQTIRRWLTMYPTMAVAVSGGRKMMSKWRMNALEQQLYSALERSQEILDTELDDEFVNSKILTVVAAQARYIIGLFSGQKIDVNVTHELGDTVMKAQEDAFDYISAKLLEQQANSDVEPVDVVYRIVDSKPDKHAPMLDEDGNSLFGKVGEFDTDESGTVCHICGKRLKNLQKHVLGQHDVRTEEYELTYMVEEGSLRKADGYYN